MAKLKVESTTPCFSPRRLRRRQREQRSERGPRLRQHEQRFLEHECEHRRAPIQVAAGRIVPTFGAIQAKRSVLEPCLSAKNDRICAVLVAKGTPRSEESAGYLQSI